MSVRDKILLAQDLTRDTRYVCGHYTVAHGDTVVTVDDKSGEPLVRVTVRVGCANLYAEKHFSASEVGALQKAVESCCNKLTGALDCLYGGSNCGCNEWGWIA